MAREKTGAAKVAQIIRDELKRFKGVKFSVRSENYAGGSAVRISWVDGPTTEQVREITGRYLAGAWDGMEDRYAHNNEREEHTVSFIEVSREHSEEAVLEAIKAVDTDRVLVTARQEYGNALYIVVENAETKDFYNYREARRAVHEALKVTDLTDKTKSFSEALKDAEDAKEAKYEAMRIKKEIERVEHFEAYEVIESRAKKANASNIEKMVKKFINIEDMSAALVARFKDLDDNFAQAVKVVGQSTAVSIFAGCYEYTLYKAK